MANTHPDGRLIGRVQNGDVDALGELYELYKTRIFRTALAITRDQAVAEDILQETFLRLFRHADSIRRDVPVGPWLYRVAVNLSYTWVQRRWRCAGPLEAVLDHLAAPLQLLPEKMLERGEMRENVRAAIESLPLPHRVVIVLFYLEELSLKEIAHILEIPEGTAKSRLYYAREVLKRTLEEQRLVSGIAYEFT